MNTDKQHKNKQEGKKKGKEKKTCNKLNKQYITKCPELRKLQRLQLSDTNAFNVF